MRLIFQNLSTTDERFKVPPDVRAEQSRSVFDTTTLLLEQDYAFRKHDQHYDDDGDEVFLDVLDVLWSTQPYIPVGAEPIQDAYRPLANKLHEVAPSLCEMYIPGVSLESFLSLLVAVRFDEEPLEVGLDLELVTKCIAASFGQQRTL